MRMLLATVVAAALTLGLASVASATEEDPAMIFGGQPQDVRIEIGPDFIDISVDDITIPGELAREARAGIDESPFLSDNGEADGVVSSTEVDRVEQFAKAAANTHFDDEPLAFITIDGQPATRTSVTRVNVEGLTGDVDSTNPIVTDVTLRVGFDAIDTTKGSHTIRLEQLYGDFAGEYDATHFPPVNVIVTGKAPWQIVLDSVQPEEMADHAQDGALRFTQEDVRHFDEMGEYLQFTVAGDPEADFSENNSPGVEVLGLLGAVAAAIFLARKK